MLTAVVGGKGFSSSFDYSKFIFKNESLRKSAQGESSSYDALPEYLIKSQTLYP